MGNALWNRLSRDVQTEVDRLIASGRRIQAVMLMRESAGSPTPGLHACVDLLQWRFEKL
ncbi:hypothetical protein ACIRL2_28210 [Embleya sp. NPDC127516]|uniref:hypothetical protein n=1 Tax=Embleya sp. NPDC127516 TaxID=3363990 RepID=UPI003809C0EB